MKGNSYSIRCDQRNEKYFEVVPHGQKAFNYEVDMVLDRSQENWRAYLLNPKKIHFVLRISLMMVRRMHLCKLKDVSERNS